MWAADALFLCGSWASCYIPYVSVKVSAAATSWSRSRLGLGLKGLLHISDITACWCRQKSRKTVCCRNVQLMPTLFLKRIRRYGTEKRQIRRFQRNAFEYLQNNDLYCQKLESLTYISAAGSLGLCLLHFAQLFLKVKRFESRRAGRKRILTWNSHSRSF